MKKEEIQEIEDYCRQLDDKNGSQGPMREEISLLACIGLLLVELVRGEQSQEKKK